jgi:hypothetical protein
MLRDDVFALLAQRLGNRTDLDARMQSELLLLQATILEGTGAFIPWFLESEEITLTAVIGNPNIALPADFLGEIEESPLYLYDTSATDIYTKLAKDDRDILQQKHQAAGITKGYSVNASYIKLAPTPDLAYSYRWRYYAKSASPTSNIENLWLKYAADLVIAELGAVMAKHLQNPTLEGIFHADAQTARNRLYVKHEALANTGRSYQMGDD